MAQTCEPVNPLNAELNPIRHLLALVGDRHIVHFSRIRVNESSGSQNGWNFFIMWETPRKYPVLNFIAD